MACVLCSPRILRGEVGEGVVFVGGGVSAKLDGKIVVFSIIVLLDFSLESANVAFANLSTNVVGESDGLIVIDP